MSSVQDFIVTDNVIEAPDLDYVPDPRGAGHVIFSYMANHQDKVFQIEGLTGKSQTYASFRKRCVRTALAMKARGLKPEDTITILSPHKLDTALPFYAAISLGVLASALDVLLPLDELVHLFREVAPKIVFVGSEAIELMESVLKEVPTSAEIVFFGDTATYTPFADFLKPRDGEDVFRPFQPKNLHDTVLLLFSSGTTAFPKGVCINHFTYLTQANIVLQLGYCIDVNLVFASFYTVGTVLFAAAAIIGGTALLLFPKFPPNVWESVERYKATFLFSSPYRFVLLKETDRPKNIDTGSLKDICLTGTYITRENMLKVRRLFPGTRVCLVYGQTEIFGFITTFAPAQPDTARRTREKPISSGAPVPGYSYKVLDLGTEAILGANQTGEIRIKTNCRPSGYYKTDSSQAMDADGWLKTGDIGYYDEDGCFFLVDRLKDVLKFQGLEFAPATIERIVMTHPFVQTAVVFGTPDDVHGDLPTAAVVLKKDSPAAVDEFEIEKFVEERVIDEKRLRGGVKIVDRIPTTPTGKIKRRLVKRAFLQLS